MTESEAIRARHSVRKYLEKPRPTSPRPSATVWIGRNTASEMRHLTRLWCDARRPTAALLAPAAVNQQKFKFILHDDNRVEAVAKFSLIGYSYIDLGIVKYHFEVGACNNYNSFHVDNLSIRT